MRLCASLLIDRGPDYRWQAFARGLEILGYRVTDRPKPDPVKDDILVLWNRQRHDLIARKFEAVGAPVLVSENGYIGKDADGRQFYALARNYHNGAGTWPVGDDDRWSRCGVQLKPWRSDGKHILVLPQRGIGPAGVAMPQNWTERAIAKLKKVTTRPIRVRKHPGKDRPSLDPDFKDCWAAVTWGSGAAVKAIVAGIPVFHEFDRWIGAPAARFGIEGVEDPFLGDRMPMLHRLSYAQWSVNEFQTGEPFRWLLT